MKLRTLSVALLAAAVVTLPGISAQASSHREAPNITRMPLVDGTDLYMFRSYESGRDGFVTLIANYQPLQAPYGGPNYFTMDPNALYEIHIDNNGDALEDITFQFRFQTNLTDFKLPIGGTDVSIPLSQFGSVSAPGSTNLNVSETYTVNVVRGDRRTGTSNPISNTSGGSATFNKPVDNIGTKTIPDYPAYANQHIYNVNIPGAGCAAGGKVFVGQRREGFAVNLGTVFDLVNVNPLTVIADPANINAAVGSSGNISSGDQSVTTLALEVPITCLKNSDPVIGAWTTASIRQGTLADGSPTSGHRTSLKQGGAWTQVSRLGNPLVNEVVIGLKDKDKFNASKPKDDLQFATYVTNPTLPTLLEVAFPGNSIAPTNYPRVDLVRAFLTGIAPVNQPANVVPADMLRLNTDLPVVAEASQNRLGVLGSVVASGSVNAFVAGIGTTSDAAGFPNGRRPKDDVVDIALAVVAGSLCLANGDAASLGSTGTANVLGLDNITIPGVGTLSSTCNATTVPLPGFAATQLHDAVDQAVVPFLPGFPYLNHPTPGATTIP